MRKVMRLSSDISALRSSMPAGPRRRSGPRLSWAYRSNAVRFGLISKEYKFLSRDDRFIQAKTTFIKWAIGDNSSGESLRTKDMAENEHLHASDRYLQGQPYTVEQMTFLWYPWTIAVLNELKIDRSIDESDQGAASNLLIALLKQERKFWRFAEQYPVIYPSAEGLFAINLSLKDPSFRSSTPESNAVTLGKLVSVAGHSS